MPFPCGKFHCHFGGIDLIMSDRETTMAREIEIESEELDLFLASGRPAAPLKGEALRAAVSRCFAPIDPPLAELDPETMPHRIAVMWRIIRHTAHVKGLCAFDERLVTATEIHPCPWTNPCKPFSGPSAQGAMRRALAASVLEFHFEGKGLPLLPTGTSDELCRWRHSAALVARDLKIADTDDGLSGLEDLLHPTRVLMNDITMEMVLAFEELLIETAQGAIFQAGERPAQKHLREALGLSRKEARGLVALSRASLVDDMPTSVETDRAFMVAQLREQISAAKQSMNLDQEFKAMKLLAMVQGLTRSEPENQAKDFRTVVKRISAEQDQQRIAAYPTVAAVLDVVATPSTNQTEPTRLPIRQEDNEPLEPDELDALRAFDKEN